MGQQYLYFIYASLSSGMKSQQSTSSILNSLSSSIFEKRWRSPRFPGICGLPSSSISSIRCSDYLRPLTNSSNWWPYHIDTLWKLFWCYSGWTARKLSGLLRRIEDKLLGALRSDLCALALPFPWTFAPWIPSYRPLSWYSTSLLLLASLLVWQHRKERHEAVKPPYRLTEFALGAIHY